MCIITGKMIGLRIMELCEAKNICIYTVAKNADMSVSTLYSIRDGKSKNPSVASISKICRGFDIDLKEFYSSDIFKTYIND